MQQCDIITIKINRLLLLLILINNNLFKGYVNCDILAWLCHIMTLNKGYVGPKDDFRGEI